MLNMALLAIVLNSSNISPRNNILNAVNANVYNVTDTLKRLNIYTFQRIHIF